MTSVYCDYKFCIYSVDNHCVLDDIEITIGGICQSCIVIELTDKEIAAKKKKALQ